MLMLVGVFCVNNMVCTKYNTSLLLAHLFELLMRQFQTLCLCMWAGYVEQCTSKFLFIVRLHVELCLQFLLSSNKDEAAGPI